MNTKAKKTAATKKPATAKKGQQAKQVAETVELPTAPKGYVSNREHAGLTARAAGTSASTHYSQKGDSLKLLPLNGAATQRDKLHHESIAKAIEAVGNETGEVAKWLAANWRELGYTQAKPDGRRPIRQLSRSCFLARSVREAS